MGELMWYLAGRSDLEFIAYYLSGYAESADEGVLLGAYGPRLLGDGDANQIVRIVSLLRDRPDSRQAVVQIFSSSDLLTGQLDVPCTCSLQFFVREEGLELIAYMRSNDVFLGLPHDVFAFTMLQELVARDLGLEPSRYTHMVGSFHLYERNIESAQDFVDEGWQSSATMPPMPPGDPWPAVQVFLDAESAIPGGESIEASVFDGLDPYWADLIRLLQIHRSARDRDLGEVTGLRGRMSERVYDAYIQMRIDKLASQATEGS